MLRLNYDVFLPDGGPGTTTVTDSCAGPQPVSSFFSGSTGWTVPGMLGATCTIVLQVETLQGSSSELAMQYQISP
jgi:hypothetical protein